jgi:AcrR family transcriptional regulator
VNRATFYAHFEDKQALVNYSIQANFQEVLDDRLPSDPMFTPDNLHLLTLATCEFLEGFVGRCAPSARQNHVPLLAQVQARLYDVLLEWLQSASPHLPSTKLSLQLVAMATSWTIFGAAFEWAHGKRDLSAMQLADQLLPLLAQGLPSINNSPA